MKWCAAILALLVSGFTAGGLSSGCGDVGEPCAEGGDPCAEAPADVPSELGTPIAEAPADAPTFTRPRWRIEVTEPLEFADLEARQVQIAIPNGEAPEGGWPFLVVTDGDSALSPAFHIDETIADLVFEGHSEAAVIVAVPAVDRTEELNLSWTSQRLLARRQPRPNPSSGVDAFADFIATVVLPEVRRRVPLCTAGAILGYSYGGLAAVLVGLRHPDVFRSVVAMSPSLWSRNRSAFAALAIAEELPGRWWIDVGTEEGDPREAIPYMVADARLLRDTLRRRGAEVGYDEAPGVAHDFRQAGLRMRNALAYALASDDSAPAASCDEAASLTLHPFRHRLRRGQKSAVAVRLSCSNEFTRTLANEEVSFRAIGSALRVARSGTIQGRSAGTGVLRARYNGMEDSAEVRVLQ